jgi:putative intracellular protease/amidase
MKLRRLIVTLASPKGGPAPLDPFSFDDMFMTENTRKFQKDPLALLTLANTLRFNDINTDDYAGVFFPGGYGQLWDLASDLKVIRAIEDWIREKTPVAMVCHAPAILRDAKNSAGEPPVKGKDVTGFTDARTRKSISPVTCCSRSRRLSPPTVATSAAQTRTGCPMWSRTVRCSPVRTPRRRRRSRTRWLLVYVDDPASGENSFGSAGRPLCGRFRCA